MSLFDFNGFMDLVDNYGIFDLKIGKVILESIPWTNEWMVYQDIHVTWQNRHNGQAFCIPAGTNTDLASVPKRLQSVISPCGPIKDAAVMHDGLYMLRPQLVGAPTPRVTRSEADYLLYVGCQQAGMTDAECEAVFGAVRLGGSVVWHRHDKEFEDG